MEGVMSINGKIVFASGRSTDFDIWTLDCSDLSLSQLTTGEHLNDHPVWSPDGKQIAFISTREDFIPSLWLMNSDGSSQKALTSNIFCKDPSWAPDGSQIYFTANADNPDEIQVCTYDLAEGTQRVLFEREGVESNPHASPDGKKIVFCAMPEDEEKRFTNPNTEIWEYNIATQNEKRLTTHGARDYCPVYSPDGSQIAFVSHRNGRAEKDYLEELSKIQSAINSDDLASIDEGIAKIRALAQDSDIHIMNADGSNVRQLTHNSGADVGLRWSPCGKYLVFSCSSLSSPQAERLKIIDAESGAELPLKYDRSLLASEVGADPKTYLNASFFAKLVPDFIEKQFVDPSFWGEERNPDWTNS
jgi:Tol biopolymer transport system component